MEYKEPKLHSLQNSSVSGDSRGCGPGSAAGGVDECTVGGGDFFGTGSCLSGTGAGLDCADGGGAAGSEQCETGNGFPSYCFGGNGEG